VEGDVHGLRPMTKLREECRDWIRRKFLLDAVNPEREDSLVAFVRAKQDEALETVAQLIGVDGPVWEKGKTSEGYRVALRTAEAAIRAAIRALKSPKKEGA